MKTSHAELQKLFAEKASRHKSTTDILDVLGTNIDARTGVPKYPSGIRELDDLTFGLHRKELMVIGARPSHAKTSLSLAICWNLAKLKVPTIFVSLEMSRESILERIMCQEYKLSGWRLRKGDMGEKERFFKRFPDLYQKLAGLPFQIIDYMGRSIKEIEYILEEFKPECLFIDYIQKINTSGHGSRYEALSQFVQTVQDFAIQYDCAIVLNSQINRGGEFLKGAGEIEETADCFIKCRWPWKDDMEYSDPKEYEIQVEKQRHGPCDFRLVNFNADNYSFESRDLPTIRPLNSYIEKIEGE